jgi:hypothetical protein
VSIFSINYWAARFVLILLAAFSLLWAARAQRNPLLVSLFVLGGFCANYRYVEPYRREMYGYTINRDNMREAIPLIGDDTVWVLSAALTNDGHFGGRLGQVHFEYMVCPRDGNWTAMFSEVATRARWIILPGNNSRDRFGPAFETVLGPTCPITEISSVKEAATAAGWHYRLTLTGLFELWTTTDK